MAHSPCFLNILRRPTWFRDITVAVLGGVTILSPCYAGIPDWWINRGVIKAGAVSENKSALTAGQFKHAVTQAVAEMNEQLAGDGGAGSDLNYLIANWEAGAQSADHYVAVNVGQVKAVLKLWYDRLNSVHGTSGYPWSAGAGDLNYETVNIGQLKKLLRIDVRLPWTQNLAQTLGVTAGPQLTSPSGDFDNLHAILSARDHYLRNPLLSLGARGGQAVSLPANAENLPSIPAATSAGEFKVGQDGSANYTIRLQGPKGVANVEPALSLEYNSNGGDGILGQGWSLAGLSVINRGPTSLAVDGFYDPVDFDDNDRFYLNGERLICVSGTYGDDGSEYRTLKDQHSKVIYHENGGEDWFEVFTKAGLVMEFGHCETSSIGPISEGGELNKTTWAVCKVSDSLGNFWQVEYTDSGPGPDPGEDTPYLPDYQPSILRYTGGVGRDPIHEIRFIYETRPDAYRGYLMGSLVRKTQRLCGIEVRTDGVAIRSWRLKYNISLVDFAAQPASRSCLSFVQEVAGGYANSSAPALPATQFFWDEGMRGWEGDVATEAPQTVSYPGGVTPYLENDHLQLEHPMGSIEYWIPKSAQYVDLDGDGLNEILFNHRGPLVAIGDNLFRMYEFRQVLKPDQSMDDKWQVSYLPDVESGFSRGYAATANPATGSYSEPSGVKFADKPKRRSEFPYLTTAAAVPTGASLVDINGDGLPDIVSSGTFDYLAVKWESGALSSNGTGEIINASGVWINDGGSFVKDDDGIDDTSVRHDIYSGAPLVTKDNWGDWRFPPVPNELSGSDGGALIGRPTGATTSNHVLTLLRAMGVLQDTGVGVSSFTIPEAAKSGENEVLGYPLFALFKEHDLGWRFVDMDGDGDMDIIRAGQGYEESGWIDPGAQANWANASVGPARAGDLSPKGRQLCFGLRNNGPDAPPGERWTLINPQGEALSNGAPSPTHLKSIWKLPLPLVDDNGKLDMGRRLIDLNGDGLPDFLAQKTRTIPDSKAPWTTNAYHEYDLEVWINGGEAGWIPGGDQWRLEGLMITRLTATGAYDLDYGRMIQDMNGDGLPDFIVSNRIVTDDLNILQQGVFLNNGNGWVKKKDSATGRHLPVNQVSLIPPQPLFFNRVPRPYSLIDMNGDGRPEFLNGRDADGFTLPSSQKLGRTHFMSALGGWIISPQLAANQDWNLPDELLAGTNVPLNFTELNGDGMMDILRSDRESNVSKTYFRPSLFKAARIHKVINGLGVPIDVTYGHLSQLAGNSPDHHYRHGIPSSEPLVRSTIPPVTVVTGYTTLDGTQDALGNGDGSITTNYYYSGFRSHTLEGSLGFASMETRVTNSDVRQVTYFSQDVDTVGMPVGGETYHIVQGQPILLSLSSSSYASIIMDASLEVPGKDSYFTYAHTVINENWSPNGVYMGKTTSVSNYGTTGAAKGMLTSQVVTLDQATAGSFGDDTSSSTIHEYYPRQDGAGEWRIGQIRKSTVTSNAPGTPSVQKVSEFEYYDSGNRAGLLKKETIDPGTDFAVTKEHVYDDSGNEVKNITTAAGMPALVSETWYDASGRFPVSSVNALGHATVASYDPVHSLVTSSTMAFQGPVPGTGSGHSTTPPSAPSGIPVTSTVYDDWGTAKVTTGPDGLRSLRLAQYFVDSALPRALYYTYEQSEGSSPIITYYDRYHRALLIEKTGFSGETIFQEKQYDAKGRPVRVSKPYIAGADTPAYTVEVYDNFDRKKKVIAPDGSWVEIEYDGFETTITNHRGQQQTRVADMQERVVQSTDTDSNTVTFAYTADGQPRSSTVTYSDEGGGTNASTTILTTYNAQRLKESVTDPNTGTSWTYYDAYGRVQATKDNNGISTLLEYDLLGRATKRWTGVAGVTGYMVGPLAPAACETLTVTAYDTAPGMGIGKPHTVAFTHYNGLQHNVSETFAYDSLGRPTESSVTLAGQVAQPMEFNGTYTSATTYYPSSAPGYGRTATITDPGGFTRASVYNSLGFLEKLCEGSASGAVLWQGKAYDAEGRTLEEEHGNGLSTRNRYHPTRGFVESSRTFRTATQAQVQNLELRVNDIGNVEWRRLSRYESAGGTPLNTPQVRTETFAFDSQNRLTSSYVVGQSVQSFSYSDNGNILSKTGVGTYIYGERENGPHMVTSVSDGNNTKRSYSYDKKGRMLKEFVGQVTKPEESTRQALREIKYTSFDQPQFIQHWGAAALTSDLAVLDDGLSAWDNVCTVNYYFGPSLGRIIQTKVKGLQFTKILSLGGYEIRETRLNGFGSGNTLVEKEERSSFGNGSRVNRWTAASPTVPVTAYEYSVGDHLGSDSATYDGEGELQAQRGHLKSGETQKSERQSYDAWGARRDAETWAPAAGQLEPSSSTPPSEREGSNLTCGFTGHEMLDDVGLIHMNGRLYDPALGRMCAADPYVQTPENVQNYNRYSYVLNNPLSQIDPSGHFIVGIIAAIVGAIVGIVGAVIATVVAFVAYLAALAAQFVITVVSSVVQAFGAIGNALLTAAKSGIALISGSGAAAGAGGGAAAASAAGGGLTVGKVLVGAALGATYNGIQAAINGGGLTDILKAAAMGAVTGAVGAVVGAAMHGLGDAVGSMLVEGGKSISGTVVHLAAHGVAGGVMSEAMGGSFKDGFIGGIIGAGVSGVMGHAFGGVMDGIGIVGRTAVAALSGGMASVLAGGKFADGAFSAGFFHLFNNEGPSLGMWLEATVTETPSAIYQGLARLGDTMIPFAAPSASAGVYDDSIGGGAFAEVASVTNPVSIMGKLGIGQKISQGWNKLKSFASFRSAAKTGVTATQPNRIYSARELIRRADEPGPFHNFPESFNAEIFQIGTKTVTPNFWRTAKPNMSNDSIMYSLPGQVNGRAGVFEIGVRPSASGNTEVIMHRFFRKNPR
jgi:RHS repeat-associated protein